MLPQKKADELVEIAGKQLMAGLTAKMKRMEQIREYTDLYNNKTVQVDAEIFNIPFPYFANFIDTFQSKIDNSPSLTFKIPNKKTLSEKIKASWVQESNSTRAGWARKDRAEKKQAIIAGRAVCKVYASSAGNKYQSHYDLVDIYSFVADPTRGQLMDGNYHGETDIFKTTDDLQSGVDAGIYSASQVAKLQEALDPQNAGTQEVMKGKFDRLKALGIDIETQSFAGQTGNLFCEWVMRHGNEWFYLVFDPKTNIWIRAEKLRDVFGNNKTPFISWATHYDEYAFWSKSLADDIAPVSESMRFLINNALENEKRRTRPMRMVDSGALIDVNELQDYVPDNVILRSPGRDPNIVTVETPEITGTINLVEYLDSTSQAKTGIQGSGVQEKDAKVGIFYGQLQQEADRVGVINKEYNESYSPKGYNYFWGIKEHLTKPKQVEMHGKSGIKLQQLDSIDLQDVDDVDDILVTGGSAQDELDAVEREQQVKIITQLVGAYPQNLNPKKVIATLLKKASFDDDDVQEFLDVESTVNRELMEEADEAIQAIMLGETPDLNNGADVSFMQRIQDFVINELNWIKLNKNGQEVGVDKKKKELSDRLMAYMTAHQEIVIQNQQRKLRQEQYKLSSQGLMPPEQQSGAEKGLNIQPPSGAAQKLQAARPFESPTGTPGGAASTSQTISGALTP